MPYFVYRVYEHPESKAKKLTYIEAYPDYRTARERVRAERQTEEGETAGYCRLIFAKNDVEAEKLLSAPRDERVIGEDA